MDCLIPLHCKDNNYISACVESCKSLPDIDRIVIVSEKGNKKFIDELDVEFVDEDLFAPGLKRSKFKSGWVFQQFLKLCGAYSKHIKTEQYLVVDADTIFLHPQALLEGNKPLLFGGPNFHRATDRYIRNLFELHIKYFGMTTANAHNFICHNMIFEKKYVREMVGLMKKNKIRQFKMYLADKFFNMEHGFFWREFTRRDLDYFSEYQLYGEYMIKNHPNEFKIRKNLWGDFPWHPEWFKKHPTHTQKMLKALRKISPQLSYASFHNWLGSSVCSNVDVDTICEIYEQATTVIDIYQGIYAATKDHQLKELAEKLECSCYHETSMSV